MSIRGIRSSLSVIAPKIIINARIEEYLCHLYVSCSSGFFERGVKLIVQGLPRLPPRIDASAVLD